MSTYLLTRAKREVSNVDGNVVFVSLQLTVAHCDNIVNDHKSFAFCHHMRI